MRRVILVMSCFRNGNLDNVVLAFCRRCSTDESAGREFVGIWNPVASPDAGPLDRLKENLASLSDTLHQHSEAMYALALAGLNLL